MSTRKRGGVDSMINNNGNGNGLGGNGHKSSVQRLRLSVAQIEAADTPASTALTSASSIETN